MGCGGRCDRRKRANSAVQKVAVGRHEVVLPGLYPEWMFLG
jgi:hypothetical protein